MGNVIVDAGQVTPDWLTVVLREKGALPQGQVTCVTPGERQSTFASSIWRLDVKYSINASRSAPKRLFLKTTNPNLVPGEFDAKQLHKEVIFYTMIAPAMGERFTIPCYDTVYNPETEELKCSDFLGTE